MSRGGDATDVAKAPDVTVLVAVLVPPNNVTALTVELSGRAAGVLAGVRLNLSSP